MRIIKRGTIPPRPTYRGECDKCGCVFECDHNETVPAYFGPGLPNVATQCPTCVSLVRLTPVDPAAAG